MGGFERLFEPGRVGALTVRNRIVMPAMGTGMAARDGSVTDTMVNYYGRRSRGGAGIVICEVTNVHPTGTIPCAHSAYDDRYVEGLTRLASEIKAGGARAFCQLYHPGRQAGSRVTGHELIAPSAIATRPANETPKPASRELIEELIESFVQAAERVAKAGFEGVEFHGAHGYLICAFLSPASNHRDDKFGGDTVRRARFATEIIRRSRQRLGPDYPITCRISAVDGLPGGIDLAEGVAIARLLEEAGVDAISVSAGCYDSFEPSVQPMWMPRACLAPLSTAVRAAVHVPVIVAGRINDPSVAESVLAEGSADFVAIGRGLLADPDFPLKAREGRADEIRQCLACNTCIDTLFSGKPLRCLMNPELAKEGQFVLRVTDTPKRVAVVGGGPGGMQAASLLAERGHRVTIYERERLLGGKIPLCAAVEWKHGFQQLADHLVRRVEQSGVEVRLGQMMTAELIKQEAPDVVVLACGADAVLPDVPGLTAGIGVFAEDVLQDRVTVGHRVFIMGGGYTACELALQLARRGHDVTVARRGARFGNELGRTARWTVMPELISREVRLLGGVTYKAVDDGAISIERDGASESIAFDTLIVATGYEPRRGLADSLSGFVAEVHVIGDCAKPRNLIEALTEAATVASAI